MVNFTLRRRRALCRVSLSLSVGLVVAWLVQPCSCYQAHTDAKEIGRVARVESCTRVDDRTVCAPATPPVVRAQDAARTAARARAPRAALRA